MPDRSGFEDTIDGIFEDTQDGIWIQPSEVSGVTPDVDSLDQYEPTLLVDIMLASTHRYATRDIYISDVYYKGTLSVAPEINRELSELMYGIEQTQTIKLRLSNIDNGIDDTWDTIIAAEDIRGADVKIQRYDPQDGTWFEARGTIIGYILNSVMELSIEIRNDRALDTLLPKDIVTADVFHAKALDMDATIPILFGHCYNVPLANIKNDLDNDEYDYLIGYGPIEGLMKGPENSLGVKRDGVLVNEEEYEYYDGRQGSPYPGYAFIRFDTEQRGFGGQFFALSADVEGLLFKAGGHADRGYARVIKQLLSNTTFGLGATFNDDSFFDAQNAIDAFTDFYCDRAIISQERAADIINEMLFVCRSRLGKNTDGEWEMNVDGTGSSLVNLGDNDGFYNNCKVHSVSSLDVTDAIKKAIIQFNLNKTNHKLEVEVNNTFGTDRTYKINCITETATAKKFLSYIKRRSIYSKDMVDLTAGMEVRQLIQGDIFTLTCPARGIDSQEYVIQRISKTLKDFKVTGRKYNSAIFGDETITDPAGFDEPSATVYGPKTIVGSVNLGDGKTQPGQLTLNHAPGKGDIFIKANKDGFDDVGASGFIFGIDDSDGNKVKFILGTKHIVFDGSNLSLNIGDFTIKATGDVVIKNPSISAPTLFAAQIRGGSIEDLEAPLSIDSGGTEADNIGEARVNLGLGSLAIQEADAVDITGGDAVLDTVTPDEIILDCNPEDDHTARGTIINHVIGETLGFPTALYLDSTDLKFKKAKSDSSSTMPCTGIAMGGGGDEYNIPILIRGFVRDDSWGWTVGGRIYVDESTAGALTQTKPAIGQAVGYAFSADIMYFDPDLHYTQGLDLFENWGAPTDSELTISSGAVTATRTCHAVDTEGDAATDDLVTINGGAEGDILILHAPTSTRTVVIKHGTGNIWLNGLSDFSLDSAYDRIMLMRHVNANWVQVGGGNNGG